MTQRDTTGGTVQYVGVNKLSEMQQEEVDTLMSRYHEKCSRLVGEDPSIVLQVKTYEATGVKRKYSVNARLTAGRHNLVADKHSEWSLRAAIHGTMRALLSELKHELSRR